MDVLLLGHVNVLSTALLFCFGRYSVFTMEAARVQVRGIMDGMSQLPGIQGSSGEEASFGT